MFNIPESLRVDYPCQFGTQITPYLDAASRARVLCGPTVSGVGLTELWYVVEPITVTEGKVVDPAPLTFVERIPFGRTTVYRYARNGEVMREPPFRLAGQPNPLAVWREGIELAGVDLPAAAGKHPARIVLYWRASTAVDTDYKVFVHIRDSAGRVCAQDDAQPAAGRYPTSRWQAGDYMVDSHAIDFGTASCRPGEHTIVVGLYGTEDSTRLDLASLSGNELIVGSLRIRG